MGPTSLAGLVGMARERMLNARAVWVWYREAKGDTERDATASARMLVELGNELVDACRDGFVAGARAGVSPDRWHWREVFPPHTRECQPWLGFYEVLCLADDIDSFLTAHEGDTAARPLARDCRADLDLLGVLADFCQDNARPRSADDARHLREVVRSTLASLGSLTAEHGYDQHHDRPGGAMEYHEDEME